MGNAPKRKTATKQKSRTTAAQLRHAQHQDEEGTPWTKWAIRGGGVVLGLVVIWFFLGTESGEAVDPPQATQFFTGLGRGHVEGTVAYAQTPPVGGDHNGRWLNCGVYDAPVQNENAVHALEHGAIWITYDPTLSQDEIDKLIDIERSPRNTKVVVSPYDGLPSPIGASVWGAQIQVDNADDSDLSQFVDAFRRSDFAPEPGGACSGGVGIPS